VSADPVPEALFGALLDPCGFLTTTPDGLVVTVNETFLSWTGYTRDALVGRRTFASLLSPGGRIYHETHYAPMLRMSGTVREIALDVVRADGTRLPVLVNSILDVDPSGLPSVVRTAVFDATERREYERELLRAKDRAEESEARARLLARTLQQTLIPPAPPSIPGLDVAAAYRPAGAGDEVGGDFYDVFQVSPGEWVVVIGDVCGKGVDAAVVTAVARYTLRAAAVHVSEPAQALATLNGVLLRHESDRFCTVAFLRLRRSGGRWHVTIGVGGHPLPLLLRSGTAPVFAGTPGSLVGVLPDPSFTDAEVVLEPGDALLVYTDGVTEGRRGDEEYGEDRLRAAVVRGGESAASLTDTLLGDVLDFQGGDARDDIAIVAVRCPLDPLVL
jgi:sigma-B regulation protein RsbU (phosphoserine phosphatase)